MSFSCVKVSDARRTIVISDWQKWIKSADKIYTKFVERLDGESPFEYHEVSCVGLLSCAAAMAGYLPMLEYNIIKIGRYDRRRRSSGRADLWFETKRRCYSFEVKKTSRNLTFSYLQKRLDEANDDIKMIQKDECHIAAACLIATAADTKSVDLCHVFANSEHVDMAYSISPSDALAFLFFKVRGSCSRKS